MTSALFVVTLQALLTERAAAGEEGATGEADVGEGRRHAVRRKLLRGAAAQRPCDVADAAIERAFRLRL